MADYFKLGRSSVTVLGNNPVADSVRQEMVCLPRYTDATVIFNISTSIRKPAPFTSEVGVPLSFGGMQMLYAPNNKETIAHLRIRRHPLWAVPFTQTLRRLRDWNFLYPHESKAKDFWYDVFDWVTQIENLKVGQSWMHASAVAKGERCVSFLALGGVGKTTSMLKLCLEDGWRYLSDDLGLVDVDGIVYRSPKRMQVYAYNLEGQELLQQALLGKRSLVDLAAWHYRHKRFGPKAVRRRVSIEDLLGAGSAAQSAKATDFVFLERTDAAACSVTNVSAAALADRMVPIVMSEISPYSNLASTNPGLPEVGLIESQTRSILTRAFSTASTKLVKIGKDVGPNVLVDFLRREVI